MDRPNKMAEDEDDKSGVVLLSGNPVGNKGKGPCPYYVDTKTKMNICNVNVT
jgi:hypothetical protein